MQRPFPFLSFVLGLAALAPGCAEGTESPESDVAETAPSPGASTDGGAPDACVPPCTNGAGTDADGDGYPEGIDCDDADPKVNPGATEICNGKDDDCDGKVDDDADKDNDGFTTCARGNVPADCDDSDPNVRPGGVESCNGKDDDCNGKVDDIPAMLTGPLLPPIDPHWAFAGAATAANGWAQLTQDVKGAKGALWWNAAYTFDTFDVSGTLWLQPKTTGADGLGFAWVPGTDVTAVGAGGEGFGILGLGGYGVVIDTFQNAGQPAVPFLAVYDGTTGAHLARAAIPDVRDGNNHRLRVKLDAGKVSAWLDTISYINDFSIPGYAPFTGRWGFTGGTGGSHSAYWVQDISMSFPNGQGCVP